MVQGWDRTQPLTVDSPASQGLLFPIEATKSKGSQRERHTRPDSDSVRHDRFTCPSNLDRGADTSTLTTPLTLKAGTGIQLKTDSEAVKTSPHGVSPSVRSTPGIRDAAPALYNYVCSVLQQDSDPSPTNPGHSVLPSDMAPRTNIISARLSNSPEEARVSVGTGTQGGTTRGSPPTVGGSFSVDSGGSFSVGNIGQSLPGIVSVSGGVTPETMTGLPTLAPVISGQPRLHSDSPGRGIVEGCLLTPGTRPNSLPQSQVSVKVTGQNGCDNTPLGDPGRALGQPEVKTASPEPAMAMVWAVDEEAVLRVDNPIFESEFRENGLFNRGAEHTARTAPVQWTQSCQPCPDPSVESEDNGRAVDGAQRVVNPLCTRGSPAPADGGSSRAREGDGEGHRAAAVMAAVQCCHVLDEEVAGESTPSRKVLEDEADCKQDHAGSANAAAVGAVCRGRVHDGLSAEEFTQQCSMWCLRRQEGAV